MIRVLREEVETETVESTVTCRQQFPLPLKGRLIEEFSEFEFKFLYLYFI